MKNRYSLLSVLLCASLLFACSKESTPVTPERYFVREGILSHFDNSLFEGGVAYLGGLSVLDERWIRARAMNQMDISPEDADIIIIGRDMVSSELDILRNAYDNGKFVIVGDADLDSLRAYRERFGWDFVAPVEKPEGRIAFAFAPNYSALLSCPSHLTETGSMVIEEGSSPFQAMRSLIDLIKKARQDKSTKSSVDASGLDVPDQVYSVNFPLYRDVSYQITADYTMY